jgi:hypothetical protein
MAGPIAFRVLDRFIAQRVARRIESATDREAFGVTDLEKLSKMGRSFGVISAYRSNLSKKKNQQRHGELMADLQKAGHRPHAFKSQWEDMATGVTHKEKSLFVPGIDFRTLHELGQKYEQDAILFKDRSGSIGVYFKDNTAVMAFNDEGKMDVTKSTDPGKEYSRGRGVSFGLRLVEDKKFPFHGKPITQQDVVNALA